MISMKLEPYLLLSYVSADDVVLQVLLLLSLEFDLEKHSSLFLYAEPCSVMTFWLIDTITRNFG